MLRSGFGGRHGNKSARSAGKIRIADKSSNFLNLVKSIGGDDLLFCVDALSINDIAEGAVITNWNDAWGVWATNFTGAGTARPALNTYNGKRALSFDGSDDFMNSAANLTGLNGKKALSIAYFFVNVDTTNFGMVLEYDTLYSNVNGFIMGPDADHGDYNVYNAMSGPTATYNIGAIVGGDAVVDANLPLVYGAAFDRDSPGTGKNKGVRPSINGSPITDANVFDDDKDADMSTAWTSDKTLYLGKRAGGSTRYFIDGSMGCMVAITRTITVGEMSRLSAAMLDRWNVGSGAPLK